ncbi:hypothetical protein ILYODFUR_038115 [Ilyodon furcidens]|uniref:Uncharacterized protein n=1 Tax=Ilyodon furcidens TaxID=33524 RepID=A0ABV0STQ4_9TELE
MCIQGFSIKICSSECEEPQTRPPGPRTDTEEIRDTDFTFLLKTIRFVSIVFHIIIARSTQPDNESKGKDKKLLFAYTRYRNCATQADWQFGCSVQERWPASFITRKVTLSASNRATIWETAHFRAAVDPTREREPGGCVRLG